MPKRDFGYYITKEGNSYHQEKACASKHGSTAYWYQDAHEARTAAQERFDHKVVRCQVCCSN